METTHSTHTNAPEPLSVHNLNTFSLDKPQGSREKKSRLPIIFAGLLISAGAIATSAPAQAQTRDYRNPTNGHLYRFVPGAWTQDEAWQIARNAGGYPVVFSSLDEHKRVVNALNFRAIAPAWTGHYQDPHGEEPGVGWTTFTGERSAPINKLFNSDGPDDGVRFKWGLTKVTEDDGSTTYYLYGPSQGKNEDGAVIWSDNNGLLEDVSRNQRCGVVIEFNAGITPKSITPHPSSNQS